MRTSTGFRHRATALTLLVALFIILGGASQPLFVSAQIKKTTVTFTFSPSKGYIDPGVNQSSTVFTGTVTVKGIPLIVTSVNITADTGSWTNNSNPTSLVITGPKSGTFELTVYAPYDARAGDSHTVNVTIHWTNTLNEKGTAEAESLATVNQSYSVSLYTGPTFIAYKPGKSSSPVAKVYVSNSGNSDDTFLLSLVNNSALLSAGWSFSFSQSTVNVNTGDQQSTQLTVSVPLNAPVQVYKVQVRATSQGAQTVGKSVYGDTNLTISVQSTGSGGGTGTTNGTKKNSTGPVCMWSLIPMALVPLTVSYYGVRTAQGRRPQRNKRE